MKKILFLLTITLLFSPLLSQAAILYLEPAKGQYYQGDTFLVEVRIEVEEECINAAAVSLIFPNDILEAIDFSKSNSILLIWLKEPEIFQEQGIISFSGGMPGGFCGILPGDPGKTNLFGRIIFRVKEVPKEQFFAEVKFSDNSQIFLNDGFGTAAELKTEKAVFDILSGIPETGRKEWEEELKKDRISPEPFEFEIIRDPLIFDNKYFIVFQAQDKQSGIDYYEVKEGKRDWQRGESPYLLEDQELSGIIMVKAVDKAGNERIVEYLPEKKPLSRLIIGFSIIIAIVIGYLFYKKSKWKLKK